jgi:hypothetical protein
MSDRPTPETDKVADTAFDGSAPDYLAYTRMLTHARSLEREITESRAQAERLADAAGAVIARWDTPSWKDAEPTAKVISRMRKELAAYRAADREGVAK